MKRYVVHPGEVRSQNDQGWHYIGAGRLMELYGLRPEDCFVADPERPRESHVANAGLIHLFPNCYGNYELPK